MATIRSPSCSTFGGGRAGRFGDHRLARGLSCRPPIWKTAKRITKARTMFTAGPGRGDDDPLPDLLAGDRRGALPRRHLFLRVHAVDFHVAAERDRFDPVLGLAAFERPDGRAEEEEEAFDPHAGRLGGDEVARLVEDDQRAEAEEDVDPTHAGASSLTPAAARSRASASVAKRSSKWVTGRAGISSSVRSITAAMPVNGIRPSRKAATATSSAALRTVGAVPPAAPASSARRRQAKVSGSGSSKVSAPTAARSSPRHVDRHPFGVVQGVGDRHPHVGIAEVGDRRAVVQRDQRVDQRLRVDDDLDPLVGDAEEVVRLDHLEALVHQRRRVDRDPAAHLPGRVGERVGRR